WKRALSPNLPPVKDGEKEQRNACGKLQSIKDGGSGVSPERVARAAALLAPEARTLHPIERVRDVPRPAARDNEHGIETDLALKVGGMARKPVIGRAGDAVTLGWRQCSLGVYERGAVLDLDKGDAVAASGDDVDLAVERDVATGENAVAFRHQQTTRDQLRPAPAAEALAALDETITGAGSAHASSLRRRPIW